MPIDAFEENYRLGVEEMDDTHRQFAQLVNQIGETDKAGFIELFPLLVAHTQAHFDSENGLMRVSGFPVVREHKEEHQRVLGELRRIADKVAQGSVVIARAYVNEQLPAWFYLHAATMDSALAAHLKYHARPLQFASATLH